jgi:hypothetical protein
VGLTGAGLASEFLFAAVSVATVNGKELPDACRSDDLAALAAAGALDTAKMPLLQVRSIQACRAAFRRWPHRHVCSPPGSLQVLLAALLLVFIPGRGMTTQDYDSGPTSNDLLERLIAKHAPAAPHLQIQAQGADSACDGVVVAPERAPHPPEGIIQSAD